MTGLAPLYEKGNAFCTWWAANRWIKSERPHAGMGAIAPRLRALPFQAVSEMFRWIPAPLWSGIEGAARSFQQWRLPRAIRDRANRSTEVVLNDEVLKFHTTDRRAAYRMKLEETLRSVV